MNRQRSKACADRAKGPISPKPVWNWRSGELSLDSVVVGRFAFRAVNVRHVLTAFAEEGWPRLIYNPIPPTHGTDNHWQLYDVVKRLNQRLGHRLCFHLNDDGDGVWWELVGKRV